MKPVTVIGLDGATWKILNSLFDDGELPNLCGIGNNGFSGSLYSTVPSRTSPAIPSLYTGCDPSELGFVGFTKPNGATITTIDINLPRIWTVLDHHGIRSTIANVRTTFPPDEIDGIIISGDPAPGEDSNYVHPANIHKNIEGFRAETLDKRRHQELVPASNHAEEVTDISVEIMNRRFETFLELLADRNHTFNMFWIGGTDFLQHRLWDRPNQIKRFYKEVDKNIGRVLKATAGDIFVLSDHGFSEPSEFGFHINEWLLRNGYLKLYGGKIGTQLIQTGQKYARKYVPAVYLQKLLDLQDGSSFDESDPPWFDRSYKNIPGVKPSSIAQLASSSGIDINAAGDDRKKIAKEIINKLKSLQLPSGEPAIVDAWLPEDLYDGGRFIDELPDVMFQANEYVGVDPQISGKIFSDRTSDRADHIHARNGVWMGCGPRIDVSGETVDARITDVTPTILHMLSVPIGEGMQGSVQTKLISNKEPPTSENYRREFKKHSLNKNDQEEMEQWLSDMGYI